MPTALKEPPKSINLQTAFTESDHANTDNARLAWEAFRKMIVNGESDPEKARSIIFGVKAELKIDDDTIRQLLAVNTALQGAEAARETLPQLRMDGELLGKQFSESFQTLSARMRKMETDHDSLRKRFEISRQQEIEATEVVAAAGRIEQSMPFIFAAELPPPFTAEGRAYWESQLADAQAKINNRDFGVALELKREFQVLNRELGSENQQTEREKIAKQDRRREVAAMIEQGEHAGEMSLRKRIDQVRGILRLAK